MAEEREVLSLFVETSSASLLRFQWNYSHLLAEQFGFGDHGNQIDV